MIKADGVKHAVSPSLQAFFQNNDEVGLSGINHAQQARAVLPVIICFLYLNKLVMGVK